MLKQLDNLHLAPLLGTMSQEAVTVTESNPGQITLNTAFPCQNYQANWVESIQNALNDSTIQVHFNTDIRAHQVQTGLKGIPNIKNIIAVASGKGGVGKSTTTANLAIALQNLGAKVGVLDADIYGPSQPMMLGVDHLKPESVEGKWLQPVTNASGIQVMSMGFMLEDDNTPVIWRGPMVSKALQQLLFETLWDELDYLLIDLPPGTGDIQLTLCQKIPLSGAVIVTTPQDIALLDVKKAINMFKKVNVPCLGVIENMSHYECPNCDHHAAIFGSGGVEKLQQQFDLPCVGQIPLNALICEQGDAGKPVATDQNSSIGKNYLAAAVRLASQLALQAKNYAVKFPNIVITNE